MSTPDTLPSNDPRPVIEGEIWKTIPSYPSHEVSNLGRVRNLKTGRLIRAARHKAYGLHVNLAFDGKVKHVSLHRLVAEAFIGDLTGKVVHHRDGDKTNARAENLRIDNVNQPKTIVLAPESVAEIRRLYLGGASVASVSKRLRLSQYIVRREIDDIVRRGGPVPKPRVRSSVGPQPTPFQFLSTFVSADHSGAVQFLTAR